MTNSVLFSAVRNEGPFLLEWIAYHRAIGFDRIAIYSNDCDDGSAELLDVLDRAGIVEHRVQQVLPGSSAQGSAARLANAEGVLKPGDWAIWLDADEFLNIHAGNGHVADLVAALGSDLGILIPWRVFGDGGNRTFPGRFLSDAFVSASAAGFKENRQVKTFFRFDDAVAGLAEVGINRPRLKAGTAEVLGRFLGGNGKSISAESRRNQKWASGADFAQTCYVNPDELGWDLAQINHYTIRTPEYFALKKARGRGWAAGAVNDRHTADYYALMNRNDEEDRSILRHTEAVEQELSRLRALDGVCEAEQLVALKAGEAFGKLDPEYLKALTTQPARRKIRAAQGKEPSDFPLTLPAKEAACLEDQYAKSRVVLEYGSGGSSFAALRLGVEKLYTVESDRNWAERIEAALTAKFPDGRAVVHHADIGPTKAWGYPLSQDAAQRFHLYPTSVWDRADFRHPDTVLVDGRFRAACFMTTLLRISQPVCILFDDYTGRPEYHWVEDFLKPTAFFGRMAQFDAKPLCLPPHRLTQVVGAYSDAR